MNTLGKKLIRTKEQRFNQAECDKIQREALALREDRYNDDPETMVSARE
jgi:hypothetical protein